MHPLDLFKHCPKCGSKRFEIHSPSSKKCQDCGYIFYLSPAPGTAAIVFDDQGRLMAVRRSKEPAKGTLDLSGGFVNLGETLEEGVIREVKEETNIDVEVEKYLFSLPNSYVYSGLNIHPVDVFFQCKIKDMSRMKVDKSENSEIVFLEPDTLNFNDFGLQSIRNGLMKLFKKKGIKKWNWS